MNEVLAGRSSPFPGAVLAVIHSTGDVENLPFSRGLMMVMMTVMLLEKSVVMMMHSGRRSERNQIETLKPGCLPSLIHIHGLENACLIHA